MKWETFWKNYRSVKIRTDSDLLYQVGKTISGQSITDNELNEIVNSIVDLLELKDSDVLLDLCCGNGILTHKLSCKVKKVVGVDFSDQMISNARKYKSAPNIRYFVEDIKNINLDNDSLYAESFNKVLCYDALAYFEAKELKSVLKKINDNMAEKDVKILLGSVLDKEKKWNFYNTRKRKLDYLLVHKLLGKNKGLGKWWSKKEITNICNDLAVKSTFFEQTPKFYTSHYRMDIVIDR